MRFILGLGLGFLLPLAFRTLMKTERPVILQSIPGGRLRAEPEEQASAPSKRTEAKKAASSASQKSAPAEDTKQGTPEE